jgi:ferredoxin
MGIRVNPQLVDELRHYGAEDVVKCYHCGNCSAVCHHTSGPFVFPRRPIRSLQLGLEAKLRDSLEPWLCYYCGQCSEQCPRDAEPGETMMALRRWLTAQYDVTGIAKLFYTSWKAEVGAVVGLALLVGAALTAFGLSQGSLSVYDGPGAFLPSSAIHVFDWSMAAVLTAFLGINALRMWWFTTGGNPEVRVPIFSYVKSLWRLPWDFMSQERYGLCDDRKPWLVHLALMLSYVTMFVLIMFFLHRMQAGPEVDWSVHAFGYVASFGLIATVIYALRGRLKKSEVHYQYSHESDWIFLILLLTVAATGVLQHGFHRTGMLEAANITYVVHLMAVVPMLMLEVPFSKWSHLAYRPLAMYLANLHADALKLSEPAASQSATLSQPA